MYTNYDFYIVNFDNNTSGISGMPFVITEDTNNKLIMQILRDIEFSFVKKDGEDLILKIYAVEKGKSTFDKLRNYLTYNKKECDIRLISNINQKLKDINLDGYNINFDNYNLFFNIFKYKNGYFFCNPCINITQSNLNSQLE